MRITVAIALVLCGVMSIMSGLAPPARAAEPTVEHFAKGDVLLKVGDVLIKNDGLADSPTPAVVLRREWPVKEGTTVRTVTKLFDPPVLARQSDVFTEGGRTYGIYVLEIREDGSIDAIVGAREPGVYHKLKRARAPKTLKATQPKRPRKLRGRVAFYIKDAGCPRF